VIDLASLLDPDPLPPAEIEPSAAPASVYTSGPTRHPKQITRNHAQLVAEAIQVAAAAGPSSKWMPLTHIITVTASRMMRFVPHRILPNFGSVVTP
jgi:acyl-CoA synthetase (AMP-forming)/AMP-acid ligase II